MERIVGTRVSAVVLDDSGLGWFALCVVVRTQGCMHPSRPAVDSAPVVAVSGGPFFDGSSKSVCSDSSVSGVKGELVSVNMYRSVFVDEFELGKNSSGDEYVVGDVGCRRELALHCNVGSW